ncbi:MAG: M28 family peptidase [Bacteroidota bacterium]
MIKSRIIRSLIAFIVLAMSWGCASNPEPTQTITDQNVSRFIEVLSSDSMRGRQALDQGADKAAEFIATEFKKLGLRPISGEDDFYQEFPLYQFDVSSLLVTINGRQLDNQQVMISGGQTEVTWNSDNLPEVKHIPASDHVAQEISQLLSSNESMLVTVDPQHKDMFSRYKRYLERSNFQLGGDADPTTKIFVLSNHEVRSAQVNLTLNRTEHILKNVVGMIPGAREDEQIIYSAHYDHIGIMSPVDQDSIANGADDNASGTTGVLALANHYVQQTTPMRTQIFVAFTGEEMGMLGSKYFSRQLDPEEVVAMINLEMIGKPSRFGANSAYITGYDESDLGKILQHNTEGMEFSFHGDPYPEQNLFYRSDNATLARMGVPAHTISTVQIDMDSLYHSVNDEVESLNIPHLRNTIRGVVWGTQSLVDGSDTPTRVDPQRLQ